MKTWVVCTNWPGYVSLGGCVRAGVDGFCCGWLLAVFTIREDAVGDPGLCPRSLATFRGPLPGPQPAGGRWMVVFLLTDALATGLTGWLYTTDRFWGVEWSEDLHGALGDALLPLLLLHVGGAILHVLAASREPGGASMVHGRKPAPEPTSPEVFRLKCFRQPAFDAIHKFCRLMRHDPVARRKCLRNATRP